METIDKRIIKTINQHHVLTLATSNNNNPYCASCFYIYLEQENMLVFSSDKDTKHIGDVEVNKNVAGAIALETKIIGKIRGIQFTGKVSELEGDILKKAKLSYLKRFPYAVLMDTTLWGIKLNFIKLTDNRLCFGKKLIWKAE